MKELRRTLGLPVVLALIGLAPFAAAQQAWTPARGEGTITVAFGDFFVKDHLNSDGSRVDLGHVRTLILVQSVEYGFTDRWSGELALPVVASKYYGPAPHQLPVDDGDYHGGTQDFALGLRYSIRQRPVALTAFAGLTLPSRDYVFYAHSAVGTDLHALTFGIAAGRQFDSTNTYLQAAYSYSIVEHVAGVRPNRNNIGVEGGYFLGRHLRFGAFADALLTHGGFDVPEDFPELNDTPPTADSHFLHHDQSANAKHLNIGFDASVALGPRWEVFAGVTHTLWGGNEHATRMGLSIGVSRTFTTPWARRRPDALPLQRSADDLSRNDSRSK